MSKNLLIPIPFIPAFLDALPKVRAIMALEVGLRTTTYPEVPCCHVCGAPSTSGHLTPDGYVGECEEHRLPLTIETENIVAENVCGPITYFKTLLDDMLALNRAAGAIIEMDEEDQRAIVVLATTIVAEAIRESCNARPYSS